MDEKNKVNTTSSSPHQASSFELRSEEVQEILTRIPSWLIRWGSTVIFFVIVLLISICFVVKYPDIIAADITITTNTPPEKLVSRNSGTIEILLQKDKAIVDENQPIAVLKNTANYEAVFRLKQITDTLSLTKTTFPFHLFLNAQLGEIETSFALFQKEYLASELNKSLQPFSVEKTAQKLELNQLFERLKLTENQKYLNEKELELQSKDLERYEILFKKGVIATQEVEKQRLQLIQAEKNYKNLLSLISQLKSSINELKKNNKTTLINESTNEVNLERNLYQSYLQLKKVIKDWEMNYVFRSSIKGKVSYLQVWSENQTITSGETVFSIIPLNQNIYIGKAKAKAQNTGKIKVGQKVTIRLANYPDSQFGIINGYVKNYALTPDKDGNILLDIALPKGISTSFNKKITFKQEMTGTASIITDDLRLIDRIFIQFRELFKR